METINTSGVATTAMEPSRSGFSRNDRDKNNQVLDVNNFDAIRIRLASPEAIRGWSRGEVVKPETINYRTLKPEHGGLFCERIFGPTRDWECYCGKYKRIRHAGTVCDKCGVEVTRSKVRRDRMGHIELAAPVAHIWYVKGTPSRLGLLMDITPRNLERVLYFASYLVTDVDIEARDRTLEEIRELSEETIAEIEQEAAEKILQIRHDTQANVDNLEEGTGGLVERFELEMQEKLEELRVSYDEIVAELKAMKAQPAEKQVKWERKIIVRKNTAVDEADITKLNERYEERQQEIRDEADQLRSGGDAMSGAEGDMITHEANQEIKKVQADADERVRLEEEQRDEILRSVTRLVEREILTEAEFRELSEILPPGVFKAGMGAEAVFDLIVNKIDLDELAIELRQDMQATSENKRRKATKRLRVVEALRKSGNRPEWMIFTTLPVIPPELRPMVQLDGGRFATSDLNDLYRRVINRNNRLKRLLELGAPEIIVRNEKRMLQEAVDALIDNGRRGRVVSGSGKHKLKSLSDMLKGKQGRFRQNLLGKRVDYSGRSVIVIGPDLQLHECGLPKRMALELFKPFVMRRLVDQEFAHNIKSAKRLVERVNPVVWQVLEEVIENYYVLLNRAPTLHRLGIQAFKPRLIEGSAIQLHPLVTTAFNADFDGDQMAVHVPLSKAAQTEAYERMLSVRNLLAPSSGEPIVAPSQDIVLGVYYMTSEVDYEEQRAKGTLPRGWGKRFSSLGEVELAYSSDLVDLQAKIFVRTDRDGGEMKMVETTVGRALFNNVLPKSLGSYYNETLGKKGLRKVVADCFRTYTDPFETAKIVNDIKTLGFRMSTKGGLSIALSDVTMTETKAGIVEAAEEEAARIDRSWRRGLTSEEERLRELERIWNDARDQIAEDVEERLMGQNSVYMMADSGAKGSMNQISQMAGMRGLVLDTNGKIIDIPIKANYREGLTVLEYFLSTHGARKGMADTAIRTADSGYLTRRLVDVAQDVIITLEDCGTEAGMWALRVDSDGKDYSDDEYRARILGRIVAEDIVHPETGEIIAVRGEEITEFKLLDNGETVDVAQQVIDSGLDRVKIRTVMTCEAEHGACQQCYGRSLATGNLVTLGDAVGVIAAQSIGEPGTQLTMRTFHSGGVARADITTGLPRVEELFEGRQPKGAALMANRPGTVAIERSDAGTRLTISSDEEISWRVELPEGYELQVQPGDEVLKNKTVIAKNEEDEKIVSDIDGHFFFDEPTLYVRQQKVDVEEYQINVDDTLLVEDGQFVTAGTQLTYGNKDPHQILRTLGAEETQRYIIDEVQKVYRQQGVNTNDKHIEVICRQMLRKVQIQDPGDTDLLEGDTVDRFEFHSKNDQVLAQGGEPATALPMLLGITKASLETDSFLSAASFQETTRVLTEAAINGKVDHLRGLKENVIIGKLIPAGSGFEARKKREEEKLSALDEVTLAAMGVEPEAEPAEEEDYRELMEAGAIAAEAAPSERSGFGIVTDDDVDGAGN